MAPQWANVPAWQVAELQRLAAAGSLSGVDPHIIAGIDQAESSGQGGSVNPQGYGGFFGLSPSSHYPGGHVVGSAIYGTTPQAFDVQAETAAAEYASLLGQFGGDPLRAESAYQTGPNAPYNPQGEGVRVLSSLGIGGPQTGYGVTAASGGDAGAGGVTADATLTSSSGVNTGWPAGDLTLIPGTPVTPKVGISKSTMFRTVLMIVGLLILLIAINAMAKGHADEGPITLVGGAMRRTRQQASSSGDADEAPGPPGLNSSSARLASDREATQRWELLNRQHKAQSAIIERTKKAQAQDETDADVAHAEQVSRQQEADPAYQERAAGFKREAAARHRAQGPKGRHGGVKGAAEGAGEDAGELAAL